MTQYPLTKILPSFFALFLLISISEKSIAAPCSSVSGTTSIVSADCEYLSVESGGIATINSGVTITNGATNRAVGLDSALALTNNGIISGNTYGILIFTGVTSTVTNFGVIRDGIGGLSGIVVDFGGSLTNLNNAQGGNGATQATTALTYQGVLPTNYSVMVLSSTHYGQLAIYSSLGTPPSGTTTFGIHSSSVVSKGTYASVLSGITSSYIVNTTGNYNGFTWTLSNSSGTIWDLIVTGASTADTQQSLVNTASALQSIFTLQNAVLSNSLAYDCNKFGSNGVCISTGGRYSNNHGASGNTTSALLIGAYRLNKNVRLGAWVDQNLSTNSTRGVSLGNSKPLFGVFGAWAENPTGEGYEVKVSAGYGDRDLTVTRDMLGTSEAGFGTSRLKSQAVSSVSSYGFRINNEMLASPYVGIRYSRIASNGYTEAASADVTAPLSYNKLNQENISLLAGLKLLIKLDPKTTFVASAGIEQNLKNRSGQYSATGVDGLTPIEFNSNPQKTRATASLGAYYDIDKKQRVAVKGIYREETFNSIATTSVLATYTAGF